MIHKMKAEHTGKQEGTQDYRWTFFCQLVIKIDLKWQVVASYLNNNNGFVDPVKYVTRFWKISLNVTLKYIELHNLL